MSIGKWIFAGLGWSLGGPIGAVLGYVLGKSLFDSAESSQAGDWQQVGGGSRRGPYRNTGTQSDLNVALMVLVAAVMKADGAVKRDELDFVKRFLLKNYGESRGNEMLHLLRDILKRDIPIQDVCIQIKYNTDYTTRYHMLDFLFGIAAADAHFDKSEEMMLRTIGSHLGINSGDIASMYARYAGYGRSYSGSAHSYSSAQSAKDPFKVLGLTREATDDEVKKAYRRLAMKYHPDKVEGMGEEMKKNAEAQFREINEAYEQIKTMRGIK